MKLQTFLLAIIITVNAYSQNNKKRVQNTDFQKMQIGVIFSPDFCFRTLKNDDESSISEFIVNSRNVSETAKLGYTTGLNFIYNIREKLGIELGIQYSNKGFQTKMQDLTFNPTIDPRRGSMTYTSGSGSTPSRIGQIYNDLYIDIPLKFNFAFGNKKLRLIASTGVTTNIFIKETTTNKFEYADGSIEKTTMTSSFDYNKVNVSPFIGAGVDWELNRKNHLKIEPTFRYGIIKMIDAPVTDYLWNAGLNIGYYFGLK
jgi:hypothetical protein